MSPFAACGWALALAGLAATALLHARLGRSHALVAEAGHELRGPLCSARLGLHALAGAKDADIARRAVAIELELRRASLALEDLSASTRRARAGERSEIVDVGELLATAGESWRTLAHAHGAELTVETPRFPALVRADPVRLAQACGNLIANAVEHGAGPVSVQARASWDSVRVEVADAGGGLPAPVAQLVAAGRRRSTRRGHGLTVAAGIAERLGGRLAAAPSGEGARLVLELPAAEALAARRS